jgi:hypothetical protein
MHDHNVLQLPTLMHVHNSLENEAGMAARPPRRKAISVLVSVPASGSVGGGLATIGHGSDLTMLIVTLGPTIICALVCCLVVFLYCAGKHRYLNADRGSRQAIRDYDVAFADLVVSLLTRTRAGDEPQALRRPHRGKTAVPRPRGPVKREAADRQRAN